MLLMLHKTLKRQSEHSGLCPDTSSLVMVQSLFSVSAFESRFNSFSMHCEIGISKECGQKTDVP